MTNNAIVPTAPEYPEELLAQQRGALVATWLQGGRQLTTKQVAHELGMTFQGARFLMVKLSSVIPIYQEGEVWRWVDGE